MSDSEKDTTKVKPGRPKGSRNKSSLMKAQVMIDDLTIDAVLHAEALMKNDKDFLNSKDDVPYTVRFNAMKEILAKSIAAEKEKEPSKTGSETPSAGAGENVHTGPKVFSTAS